LRSAGDFNDIGIRIFPPTIFSAPKITIGELKAVKVLIFSSSKLE
jgi:hypothetical protein